MTVEERRKQPLTLVFSTPQMKKQPAPKAVVGAREFDATEFEMQLGEGAKALGAWKAAVCVGVRRIAMAASGAKSKFPVRIPECCSAGLDAHHLWHHHTRISSRLCMFSPTHPRRQRGYGSRAAIRMTVPRSATGTRAARARTTTPRRNMTPTVCFACENGALSRVGWRVGFQAICAHARIHKHTNTSNRTPMHAHARRRPCP